MWIHFGTKQAGTSLMWSAVEDFSSLRKFGAQKWHRRWVSFQHDKFETCDVSTRCQDLYNIGVLGPLLQVGVK